MMFQVLVIQDTNNVSDNDKPERIMIDATHL